MMLKEFIDVIREGRKTHRAREKVAAELCEALGAIELNEETVKKWVYEMRPPDPDRFFQQGLSISCFVNFFKEKTEYSWQDWQKAFRTLSSSTNAINCDTDNEEEFYSSLLNQFCLLIKLSPPRTLRHILPPKPELIVGRSHTLDEIDEVLTKNNCAILTGIGGIGKSVVASAYAYNLNESGDWITQHIICEKSQVLQDVVAALQFDGPADNADVNKEKCMNNKILSLQSNTEPTLIIFDNLNQPFSSNDKAVFQKLLNCKHTRVLITSRRALANNKQLVIEIGPLDNDALMELYAYHRFSNPDNNCEYIQERHDVLIEMFELVGRHTLMIELLAKLPMRSGMDEHEINQYISDTLHISNDQLPVIKDAIDTEDTIMGIIKGIFSVSQFDEMEKNIMCHMSLVPLCGIELKLFVALTGSDRARINRLKDSHWIQMNEKTLTIHLHPLICEAILNFDEIKPSEQKCHTFLTALQEKLDSSTPQSPAWYQYSKILLSARRGLLFSLFPISILKDEYRSALLLLDKEAKKLQDECDT